MIKKLLDPTFSITLPLGVFRKLVRLLDTYSFIILVCILSAISVFSFLFYLDNGLGLAYNDARSHLDIGRRVVEGLKPGLAQLGSVWLPLPHLLMVPTIWSDFFWHTGLSGALQSMISFVATGLLIFYFLRKLGIGLVGGFFAVFVFVANINILYLQSTAMTELLLLATMTAGVFELVMWAKNNQMVSLIHAGFFIMLSTLIRYDGWFLLFVSTILIGLLMFKKKGFKAMEGTLFFFLTLASLGIILWVLWNLVIFKDPLYFAYGPYSAHAQQEQLDQAGILATKNNLPLSLIVYIYALSYNSYTPAVVLGFIGFIFFLLDKKLSANVKIASLALLAPFAFNVLAMYLGHSVLFIQGFLGGTWFNVRYGLMMAPSIAIFIGYLVGRASNGLKVSIIGLYSFMVMFAFLNGDAVTLDDARVGSSQKNVTEVSGWLNENTKDEEGFILISAASHDAIIFSSGLPMKRYIHEGTGAYWESATTAPDRWARWIVMRTNDNNDQTFKLVNQTGALPKYDLVDSYPFADIYQLKSEYLSTLQTKPVYEGKQR